MPTTTGLEIDAAAFDAVIFDVDGVITDTASVHAAAWKRLFDDYLRNRAQQDGTTFTPFDTDDDYRRYVDGKPRYDGVRSFLSSRDIQLPEGSPDDDPDRETICGLGNRKDASFTAAVREKGVQAFPTSIALVRELHRHGVRTAVISASRNCEMVLQHAGLTDLFEARIDGVVADELELPGKPDPAVFLEAAQRLGVRPPRAVVVEDALAGVEAGRSGGFGLVIGVDRHGHADELLAHGADAVVSDLGAVRVRAEERR